jgi:DNA-binding helix-hairpin-helix protein with protein kinase domain
MPTRNSKFTAADGHEYRYDCELGVGGQAIVWQIVRISDGHKMAIKLFKNPPAGVELSKQQERLNKVSDVAKQIAGSLPQAQVCFPRTVHSSGGDFGVLMELASGKPLDHRTLLTNPHDQPNPFASSALVSVVQRKEKYHHFLLAGFYLTRALRAIHSHGMTHCDLSLGNVFFDSSDGRICLIDCDNLACGESYLPVKVAGTPGFRAPELITARSPKPSPESDRHSLAVLLFYLVLFRHPFIGNVDPSFNLLDKTEDEAFGKGAIFTENPSNGRNRFTGGIPYASLPKSMKEMFAKVFGSGLSSPLVRPTAAAWSHEFWQALECMAECGDCRQRFFISDHDSTCLFCGSRNSSQRWRLRFSNGRMMLAAHGRKLYEHHLDNAEFQFQRPMAELKETERGMTLKNLSTTTWTVRLASGAIQQCERGFAFRFEGVKSFDFVQGRAFIEPVHDEV